MDNAYKNEILIIGGPNAGKTHFGGQLYGRLNSGLFNYRISPQNRPADLTIFQDVLDKLWEGRRADHTESGASRSIELVVNNNFGNEVTFAFLDYAGEQITSVVNERRFSKLWKGYIDNSTSLILFIRLDEVEPLEDVANRGIPSPEELKKRNSEAPPVRLSDAAFFVELLQMLLYMKGVGSRERIEGPNLTVVLSCWDLLDLPDGKLPKDVLKERLPLLELFLTSVWTANSHSVVGLSATERTLTDEPDEEYIERTPVDFGYFIDRQGQREKDLTLLIEIFIGAK